MVIENKQPLRVCLDARLIDGVSGGIQQMVIGLASGLSKLKTGSVEFLFLSNPDNNHWLKPYIGGSCKILQAPTLPQKRKILKIFKSIPGVRFYYQALIKYASHLILNTPFSDGTIEKAGVDLMHFTFQLGFLTNVPSIYQPHDLLHLHLPQCLTRSENLVREKLYRRYCDQAQMVVVANSWLKKDIIKHYHLKEDKVKVIPVASPTDAYQTPSKNDLETARKFYKLPKDFLFYPAQTWAHKNHIALLDALTVLRNRQGLRPTIVFSGKTNPFFARIKKHIKQKQLADQVQFLGFVPPLELRCLYQLCRGMVFPSRFEGCGFPVMEAFQAGVPVACSNVTCLPELGGDAVLFFDPDNPDEIADAIYCLYTDEGQCQALVKRGKGRVANHSWEKTARILRAHYRRLTNRLLTDEDQSLLSESG